MKNLKESRHAMYSIAFDSHKRYTCADVQDDRGRTVEEGRIEHNRGSIREFLSRCR